MKLLSVLTILICAKTTFSINITCKNEKGNPTDWFINYKIPKLENRGRGTLIGQGLAYAYLLPNMKSWVMSRNSIGSTNSMMAYTFAEFYQNKEDLTFLLYNDDSPDSSSTTVGHTKGAVIFDQNSGFWLIHSIPKFASSVAYEYPSNAVENGQSVFCITFKTEMLNEIGNQLLYNAPNIYYKNLQDSMRDKLDKNVASLFSDKPNYIRKAPFQRVTNLKSNGGIVIRSFAKDNQFNDDLYTEIIAKDLKSSLNVETWRRGSGTRMDPSCQPPYQVFNVQTVNMTVIENRKLVRIGFSSMEDHSKWASSSSSSSRWICIGDINRMESQTKRGGGAACISSTAVWNAFNSAVYEIDKCPV